MVKQSFIRQLQRRLPLDYIEHFMAEHPMEEKLMQKSENSRYCTVEWGNIFYKYWRRRTTLYKALQNQSHIMVHL